MALTGKVTLNRVHIAPVSDYSQGVTAGSSGSIGGGGTRDDNRALSGAFRSYANGTTRLVVGTTTTHTEALTLRALTPPEVTAVKAMAGKTVLFRDTYGRRFWGAFLVTDITDIPLSGKADDNTLLTDVAIIVQEVSFTEGVS